MTGCATTETLPLQLTGDPLVDGYHAIEQGPPRDKVLWQYRTALAALRQGSYAEARPLLDDALSRISNIMAPDKEARQARGYFHAEAKKTFIGEPFERVMAWYYRGLVYWKDGQADNARACFRSAQIQDSDTVDKTYASDYVLLDYLDGYASAKLGGDGSDAWQRAQSAAKLNRPPPFDPKANVLFFVEYGPGPMKFATGQYGEQLRFRGGVSPVRSALIRVGQQTLPAPPYDDLYYQATTRGGRVMDHILANKAVFKSTTDAVGNMALFSGIGVAAATDHEGVGMGLMAAGLLAKIISASTTPQADVRTWENLPLYLSFAAVKLAEGQHVVTVDFLNESQQVIPSLTKLITLSVSSGAGDTVVYVSDQSKTPQTI